jgi:2,5-dihydroxypyridine 5,6-dioxygenase
MLTTDPIEPVWLEAFETVLRRCALRPGDTVAILGESQSRPALVQLAQLAAARLGCKPFHICVTSPFEPGPPVRSTGASTALQQIGPVVAALAASTLVSIARSRG